MQIILLQDIPNLGHKDDVVKVRDGYGRNFLIPQGMAIVANNSNLKMHNENLRQRSHKEVKLRDNAEAMVKKLSGLVLKIGAKTSSTGKIFGSVNTIQIAEALTSLGYEIDRRNITLANDHVKEIGTYEASIKIYKDIRATITFEVFSE
jgi:large subunit ribosomal protein L9